jgi:hypothetical protein
MPRYTVLEVTTPTLRKAWLDLPRRLYANDPNWTPHLDTEIAGLFNPTKNNFLQDGKATRYLLQNENGEYAGRVAVFINAKTAQHADVPTGGMGFFESPNDQAAANLLFEASINWLKTNGMQAMDGPINFGENDRFWGLLVDGFVPATFGMNYNAPYYKTLFETFGFTLYFDQISKRLPLTSESPFPDRFLKINDWLQERGNVTVEVARMHNLRKYATDFQTIFNDAWRFHENFSPMTDAQVWKLIKQLKFILIEEMVVFAYVEGEAAAFVIALPDLNQVFQPTGGKMSLLDGLTFLWRKRNKFAYYRKKGILTRCRVVIMGVRPKFQKNGLETALAVEPIKQVQKLGFKEIEFSWVGDFNPKMRAVLDATGAAHAMTHHTYRYYFDPELRARGTRSHIIPMDTPAGNGA